MKTHIFVEVPLEVQLNFLVNSKALTQNVVPSRICADIYSNSIYSIVNILFFCDSNIENMSQSGVGALPQGKQ